MKDMKNDPCGCLLNGGWEHCQVVPFSAYPARNADCLPMEFGDLRPLYISFTSFTPVYPAARGAPLTMSGQIGKI